MAAKGLFGRAVSFLFPTRCAFCGKIAPQGVCEACLRSLPTLPEDVCPVCGRELTNCRCRVKVPSYNGCAAPFYYEGPAKKGVWRIKFSKKTAGTAVFAQYSARAVRARFGDVVFDAVACVPMSGAEEKKRGFNQSELFARALARELGLRFESLLRKTRDTKPQRECTSAQRRTNVKGAFSVRHSCPVGGRIVLLADDVITTGSTIEECAKTLLQAGAAGVYCTAMVLVR